MPTSATGRGAAKAGHPKRRHRRFRRTLVIAGIAGAAYVVVTKTPLRAKLSELVFGPPLDDEEPAPIILPVTESPEPGPAAKASEAPSETHEGESTGSGTGTDVASTPPTQDDGASA